MQGLLFTVTVHLHGTLSANALGEFKLYRAASLAAVSISNSAASNATLEVGTSADRDGILNDVAAGNSSTPTLFTPADYNGALATAGDPYHMAKDTIVTYDLDYDGAGGTASANVCIVFYFLEG